MGERFYPLPCLAYRFCLRLRLRLRGFFFLLTFSKIFINNKIAVNIEIIRSTIVVFSLSHFYTSSLITILILYTYFDCLSMLLIEIGINFNVFAIKKALFFQRKPVPVLVEILALTYILYRIFYLK